MFYLSANPISGQTAPELFEPIDDQHIIFTFRAISSSGLVPVTANFFVRAFGLVRAFSSSSAGNRITFGIAEKLSSLAHVFCYTTLYDQYR